MKKLISTFLIMACFVISANAQTVTNRTTKIRSLPRSERRIHLMERRRIHRLERRRRHRRHRIVIEQDNGYTQRTLVYLYQTGRSKVARFKINLA